MIVAKKMGEEKPSTKLKLVEVGAEKNGKSRLAATGRKPILFHDHDNRSEAIAGIKDVYSLSYSDPGWPKQPEALVEMQTVVSKMEDSLELNTIHEKFKDVPKGTIIRTNVVDSVQTLAIAASKYCLYNSSDIRRELTIGPMKIQIPRNFDAWNAEMTAVENIILRLIALPCDTIVILHETLEEAENSTAEKPIYTGRIGVYPARYRRLLKYFNEVWRVKLTQVIGKDNKPAYVPRVYPLPTYEFDAATALALNPVEDPDISKMLTKFGG